MSQKIITIDGPSASGKSSVSRELAKKLGWPWVSTGAFYRGLAYVAIAEKVDLDSENKVLSLVSDTKWRVELTIEKTKVIYKDTDITNEIAGEAVGGVASKISQYPGVRAGLLGRQRNCYHQKVGLIAEGRDCGTVVFPEAFLKVYLTADAKRRAQRRSQDDQAAFQETLEAQKKRDKDDSQRQQAPMKMAEGALLIDSSEMGLEDVVAEIYGQAKGKLGQISF